MPIRKCLGCGKSKDSPEMLKLTRVHDSRTLIINPDSRYFGRSAYVCYNKDCMLNVIKKKKLQKSLKLEVSQEILEQLKDLAGTN